MRVRLRLHMICDLNRTGTISIFSEIATVRFEKERNTVKIVPSDLNCLKLKCWLWNKYKWFNNCKYDGGIRTFLRPLVSSWRMSSSKYVLLPSKNLIFPVRPSHSTFVKEKALHRYIVIQNSHRAPWKPVIVMIVFLPIISRVYIFFQMQRNALQRIWPQPFFLIDIEIIINSLAIWHSIKTL